MQRCVFCYLSVDDEEPKADLESKTLVVRDRRLLKALWRIFPYVVRLNEGAPNLLQQVCKERGWKEFSETASGPGDEVTVRGSQCWNLWWKTAIMNASRVSHLKSWQLTNHIPNASNFCRKDVLARFLRRLKSTYKFIFDFSPLSFNLPLEYTRFVAEHSRRQNFVLNDIPQLEVGKPETGYTPLGNNRYLIKGKKAPIWIAKPIGKSQGKGIIVFDHAAGFTYDEPCVVSEYIYRPLLINGYKFDLRIYVCIACPNPLTIYAYQEGITRFATKKYDLKDLTSTFSHLTNTAVNKQSPTYKKNKETIGYGCKWTLKQLRNYLKEQGHSDYYLWQRIWSILVLTIVGDGKDISRLTWNNSNFEFFGFDILVDENLKPHLLEVNVNPGLSSDTISSVDEEVKKPLLHDLFTLLGLPDGRELGDLDEIDKNDPFMYDENMILEQMLLSCREVESLSPQKGYGHLLQSMTKTDGNSAKGNRRLGTAKSNNHEQIRPYTRKKNINEGLPCGPRMSYERLMECKLWARDASKRSKKRKKGESKKTIPEPRKISPIAVRVPVIKGPRDRVRSRFPKNGPGMNLAPRDWEYSPISCGNWVRIYPFDEITEVKCRFRTEDCIRDSISQVAEYLKEVKAISAAESEPQLEDEFYDAKIKEAEFLTTEVWHPPL